MTTIIKCFILISFWLLASVRVYAQKADTVKKRTFSNYIKVSHGSINMISRFRIPTPRPTSYNRWAESPEYFIPYLEVLRKQQYQTIGASYERKVYENWFCGIGYMQWENLTELRSKSPYTIDEEDKGMNVKIGDLYSRVAYKMADLYAFYRWQAYRNGRHFINTGIGASYCWGTNDIVQNYWINWEPPMDEVIYLRSVEAQYWGIVPYFAYDFLFAKKRLNIGPDIRARFYTGRSPAEYNINLHFGVNF